MSIDIDRALEFENGLQFFDGSYLFSGTGEPTSYGINFPKGSVYIRKDDGEIWKKFDTGINDWITLTNFSLQFPRTTLHLIYNGTVSNGDWITYSNLTPNARIVIPIRSKLVEITWSNTNTSVEFDLTLRRNGRTETIFETLEVRSGSDSSGYFKESDINSPTFEEGDTIDIQYVDQGTNVNDLATVLFIQAVQ